jgi:hypothetical protein
MTSYKCYKSEIPLELPDDILQIIRDFSRPLTKPGWRHLHVDVLFYEELVTTYHQKKYEKLCRNSSFIQ